ncbi:hypothetical protein ACEV8A_19010 [Vibrio parahaemolyticus]|uniref:hypothetical protein n=1 Tax=Vibrio parahaemolyticus TaxID=670 RepID=UPI0011154270|nr:hypothetical protein [Vibrio parahaemolyticus]EGQ8098939.1 hypothetical protein [Vibrio parahaemolyticus]EGQ9289524.1 hypothetical protein [Vibrio parahaemolyticus]MCX8946790.1 hypothetical protein [Vibrio parahaemolyticus]HCH1149831.1 hypothetical protein [Vibrio parahaemolyticus]
MKSIKFNEQTIWKIIRIFFPEQRKWVARLLVIFGLPMVGSPVWEPYLNAILTRYFQISVPSPNPIVGGSLLALGIMGVIVNEWLDRRQKPDTVSVEDISDRKTLEEIFEELHLPTLDLFFHYGKVTMVYTPVLHYFYGLEALVKASKYYVYDHELSEDVDRFYVSLTKALSYGEYFVDTPKDKLLKFDSRRDIYIDTKAKKAHDGFTQAVSDTEAHLRELCKAVRLKFPDFDLNATSRRAMEAYKSYCTEKEKIVSTWEFSVLAEIIELEDIREIPTLSRLSVRLNKQKVDVEVALDKLIELGHVKHLYPGMSWQKYTALKSGRAYYVNHRDSVVSSETKQMY